MVSNPDLDPRAENQGVQMCAGIPDDALFSDFFAAGLKLRLNKTDHIRVVGKERPVRGQDEIQGNKRHINDGKLDFIGYLIRCHITDIRPLHRDDARIVSDAPGQLTVAHVDGIDARSAPS